MKCSSCGHDGHAIAEVSAWYMHDNHTFTRVIGSVGEMIEQAVSLAAESPCGMLGSIKLLADDGTVIRTIGPSVHWKFDTRALDSDALERWHDDALADPDILRLCGP
jgi:hypothetical protein